IDFTGVLGSTGTPIDNAAGLVGAVAAILAGAYTGDRLPAATASRPRSIDETAAGIVYNTTIPVSGSPLKPWRVASLLELPGARGSMHRTDDANQAVLVLTANESLVLAAASGVARDFLTGRIRAGQRGQKGARATSAPRFGEKRNLNAWIDDPAPKVGKSFR